MGGRETHKPESGERARYPIKKIEGFPTEKVGSKLWFSWDSLDNQIPYYFQSVTVTVCTNKGRTEILFNKLID